MLERLIIAAEGKISGQLDPTRPARVAHFSVTQSRGGGAFCAAEDIAPVKTQGDDAD